MELTLVRNSKTIHLMAMKEANLAEIPPLKGGGKGSEIGSHRALQNNPAQLYFKRFEVHHWCKAEFRKMHPGTAVLCAALSKSSFDFQFQFRHRQFKVKINNNSKLPFYPQNLLFLCLSKFWECNTLEGKSWSMLSAKVFTIYERSNITARF